MPFNGSGTYAPPAADFPAVALTVISSSKYNALINDIATALTNCVTRDGQSPPSADIPLNSHTITGAGNATTRSQYVTLGQLQDFSPAGSFIVAGTAGGTGDAIVLSVNPQPPAYTANGTFYIFIAPGTSTGAVTIRINALANLPILVNNGGFGPGYGVGYIVAGCPYLAILNSATAFIGKLQ